MKLVYIWRIRIEAYYTGSCEDQVYFDVAAKNLNEAVRKGKRLVSRTLEDADKTRRLKSMDVYEAARGNTLDA
jgi:hypothetical protein